MRGLTAALGKESLLSLSTWKMFWTATLMMPPLQIPLVPEFVMVPLCTLATGAAGLFLVVSAFQAIRWLAPVHLLIAAGMVLGPSLGVPEVAGFSPQFLCLAGGSAVELVLLFLTWWKR
jgi:hypothetical protein